MSMEPASEQLLETRGWFIGEIISWSLIIVTVLAIIVLHYAFAPQARKAEIEASAEKPDLQMLLTGRYVVGAHHLLSHAKGAHASDFTETLEKDATSPSDKLRAAIVEGEIAGKKAALTRLQALSNMPGVKKDVSLLRPIYEGKGTPSGTTWAEFQRRNGWFADLAASFGKPDSDPLRAATMHAAVRTLIGAGMSVLLGGLGVLAGLAVLIIGIVFWATGRLKPRFGRARPLPPERPMYVEAFTIYLTGAIALAVVVRYVLHLGGFWGVLVMPAAFAGAVVWPLLCGQSWKEWRTTVGLHTGKGFFREIAAGAVGYLAGLPIFAIGFLLTLIIVKLTGAHASHPISEEITANPVRVVELLLLASVWAPITEELMFRGTLFAHLRERWGFWGSAIVVSIVFAAIHPQGLAALPVLGSLALVLAAIREWRGSILGCMTAHAINNTIALLTVVWMIS